MVQTVSVMGRGRLEGASVAEEGPASNREMEVEDQAWPPQRRKWLLVCQGERGEQIDGGPRSSTES